MSQKNPFEIRFDTLAMAKEMMDRAYETQIQQVRNAMEQAKEQSKDMTEILDKYMPKMYSPQEVIKQAEELYAFVTKKD